MVDSLHSNLIVVNCFIGVRPVKEKSAFLLFKGSIMLYKLSTILNGVLNSQ